MNIPYQIHKLLLVFSQPFRARYAANVCGHKTRVEDVIEHNGVDSIVRAPLGKNNVPDYCLHCISKMTTQCTGCTLEVYIGQWIINRDDTIVACHGCMELPTDANARWMPLGQAIPGVFPFGTFSSK